MKKHNPETLPVGSLGLIPLKSCETLGKAVDSYLVQWRKEHSSQNTDSLPLFSYQKDSYIIDATVPRFGSGEAKGIINESVRGDDLYLMVDVTNYNLHYSLVLSALV